MAMCIHRWPSQSTGTQKKHIFSSQRISSPAVVRTVTFLTHRAEVLDAELKVNHASSLCHIINLKPDSLIYLFINIISICVQV